MLRTLSKLFYILQNFSNEQRKPGYHKNKQKLFQLYEIQLHNINFSDWIYKNEEEKLKLKDIIIKYDIKKFNID